MRITSTRIFHYPLVPAMGVFLLILVLTQYLSYQEYRFDREKEIGALNDEAVNAKDKLLNILYADINAANALALIYKEYGVPRNFDSISAQIVKSGQFVEAVLLVKDTIICNIYPLNEQTRSIIGLDIMSDPVVREEAMKAIVRQHVFFSGPRKLKVGGEGIWGDVPIFTNGKLIGFAAALTRLPALRKALDITPNEQGKFAYILRKANSRLDSTEYLLSVEQPGKNAASASVVIPEGDWSLKVVYSKNYQATSFPYDLSILGFLLSIISGLFTYRRLKEPLVLKKVIEEKTHEANERVKEITTLYDVSKVMQDEHEKDTEVFSKLVNIIPSGWQYPEYCEARILFAGKSFSTPGYQPSASKQLAAFSLSDGRTGSIEVVYTKEMPTSFEGPFLKEERNLLNALAETIQIYYNKSIHQQDLHESELKFRSLVEKSPVAVYIIQNNRFVYVNPVLSLKSGYSEQELLDMNMPLSKLIHEDDLAEVVENIQKRLEQNQEARYQIRVYTKDRKRVLWVEVHGAVTLYEGAPAVIGTMVDVTLRVNMEQEREKILNDLIQRNRALEDFSFMVSHQIRSPLATFMGLGNTLKYDLPLEEKMMVVKEMAEYASKLDQMIKEVTTVLDEKKDSLI